MKVPPGKLVVPPGSNRNSRGGNESAEASDGKGHVSGPASRQAVTQVNVERAPKHLMRTPTPRCEGEGRRRTTHGPARGQNNRVVRVRRGGDDGMPARRAMATRE